MTHVRPCLGPNPFVWDLSLGISICGFECVQRAAAGVNRTESGKGLRCADFLMVNTPIPYPSNTDPAAEPKTVKNSN